MLRNCLLLFIILFNLEACTSETDSSPTMAANQADDTDDSENNTTDTDSGTNTDPDDSSDVDQPVALISENQARNIMEASCLAADCHAAVDEVFEHVDIINKLIDEEMPPPDQSRYTLSDNRRAELVLFFQTR